MFEQLDDIIEKDFSNTIGLVIMKNKEILFEKAYNGFNVNDAIHITSVTKSITSLLVGIAIDLGYIKSVNQRILDFFPNYVLKRGEKTLQTITIKDLITMTAPYKFKSEPYTKVYSSDDWTKAGLDLLGGKGKIGDFKYNTVGVHILSGIVTELTGMSLKEFAEEHLFTPLGILSPSNRIIKDRPSYMTFIKYTGNNVWIHDPKGCHTAGWGLALNVGDLAKFGQLILNSGMWEGVQVVSPEWIGESIKHWSHWQDYSYGYMWWLIDENTCAAIGDGGNIIYVDRQKQVVVSMTARFKAKYKDCVQFIKEEIINML